MAEIHVQAKKHPQPGFAWVWIIVVVLIAAAVIYFLMKRNSNNGQSNSPNQTNTTSGAPQHFSNAYLMTIA